MRTITIGNAPSLTKDHYENEIELKIELHSMHKAREVEITDKEKQLVQERLAEAEKDGFKGMSQEEFWAKIDQHLERQNA